MQKNLHSTPATELQNNFGKHLSHVIKFSEPLLVKKHGKPVAVLVDRHTWEVTTGHKLSKKTTWTDACIRFVEHIKKNRSRKSSPTAVELIRQIREEES